MKHGVESFSRAPGSTGSGWELWMEVLGQDDFVPAGGQGAIALQIRRDEASAQRPLDAINPPATLTALRAEREFLRLLDGDCDLPVGVQAMVSEWRVHLRAQIFETLTTAPKVGKVEGASDNPETVAAALMQLIYGG